MLNTIIGISYECQRNSYKIILVSCNWAENVVVMLWYTCANILTKIPSWQLVAIRADLWRVSTLRTSLHIASNAVTVWQGLKSSGKLLENCQTETSKWLNYGQNSRFCQTGWDFDKTHYLSGFLTTPVNNVAFFWLTYTTSCIFIIGIQ